jgi:2',3'-cyclic-nucleotide 2'-phosphodiesterase (5'-nucleotidase family)
VKEIRESRKDVLLVDSGDAFFSKFTNPVEENRVKKAAAKAHLFIGSLNLMEYDALGIGDDDLTLGKDFLIDLSKKARFPFLSSNLVDVESKKPVFQAHAIKEVNGIRIGIFSLISPDVFSGPQDPRLKGLIIQDPVETAQRITRELKPSVDLIILLSHLGYPKDVEMAQTVPGIQIIAGAHSGVSLAFPPVMKDTVILHTPMRGMYAGRLDLNFYGADSGFYNLATKRSFENNSVNMRRRMNAKDATKVEKDQYQKFIGDTERSIKQLEGKNDFSNTILPLSGQLKEDPQISKWIEEFKTGFPEPEKSPPPKP